MARRSEHSQEQLKAIILDAAIRIVSDSGIEALTVRRLAMDIGYTVGTIYMLYANMQDLQHHINAQSVAVIRQHLQAAADPNCSPDQQLQAMVQAYRNFACQQFNRWRLLFQSVPAGVDNAAEAPIAQLSPLLSPVLQALAPQQAADAVQQAANSVLCAVQGICLLTIDADCSAASVAATDDKLALLLTCFSRGWQQPAPLPCALPPSVWR